MQRRQAPRHRRRRVGRGRLATDMAARHEVGQSRTLQDSQRVEISVAGMESPIYVTFRGNDVDVTIYCVDKDCTMSYSTREYVANLVVAALKLASTFNSWYEHPPLDRVKRAVAFLVENVNYLELHAILGSIEPRDHYAGDLSGSVDLNGWNLSPTWITSM